MFGSGYMKLNGNMLRDLGGGRGSFDYEGCSVLFALLINHVWVEMLLPGIGDLCVWTRVAVPV